jgi:hypothetical protein
MGNKNLTRGDFLEDLDIGGSIILKQILEKYVGRMWTEFS